MQNNLRICLIVLTAALFLNFRKSINCYLTGHIRNGKNSFVVLNKLHVYVKSNDHILDSAITDNIGNFNLEFNTGVNDTLFRFYYSPPSKGSVLLKTIRWFESDEPEITFYIPAKNHLRQKAPGNFKL